MENGIIINNVNYIYVKPEVETGNGSNCKECAFNNNCRVLLCETFYNILGFNGIFKELTFEK